MASPRLGSRVRVSSSAPNKTPDQTVYPGSRSGEFFRALNGSIEPLRRSDIGDPTLAIRYCGRGGAGPELGKGVRRGGGLKATRDGVWRVDVELPRVEGEARRRVSRSVVGSLQDAEHALDDLIRQVAEGANGQASPSLIKGVPHGAAS
jgi:hypothetical protein